MAIDPSVAELIKTASAGLLALLAIYTAYRLARSKAQIVRVKRGQQAGCMPHVEVTNAGETVIFIDCCGVVVGFGQPFDLLKHHDGNLRLEPGERMKWLVPDRSDYPASVSAEVKAAKVVWVELQSGLRESSHSRFDPMRVVTRYRQRRNADTWRDG